MSAVSSMTGFANAQGSSALGLVTIELRCVNSRFLDLSLKLPEELRCVEPAIRDRLTKSVPRGKLECAIRLRRDASACSTLNQGALDSLKNLETAILQARPEARPMSVAEIIAYPGIVSSDSIDVEVLTSDVLSILDRALEAFIASREREGAALAKVLQGYCDQIIETVDAVGAHMPAIVAHMQSKLTERLEKALADALTDNSALTREEVNDRIRQEVTLYALRIDVDEEMNRLKTHVAEVRRVLTSGGLIGRRLDFLMQEMNREANTLGSKAAAIEMTNASIALKLNIEQMREQIQNLQ